MQNIIDPSIVTFIESAFLNHLNVGIRVASTYALNLLYIFTAFELFCLGVLWALQRDLGIERLFFKVIKIGLIFSIIGNYGDLIEMILGSFTKLSHLVINNTEVAQYLANPAKLWQYGYNIGINLLQAATSSNQVGLILIQLLLGSGILVIFALLGVQLIVQTVGFYFVSFGALIVLPLGVFNPSRKFFDRSVQAVLQAGLRLMSVMIIIGIAVVVWSQYDLSALATTDGDFNINQPLGLLFTGLLFLSLTYYVPRIVTQVVGEVSSSFLEGGSQPSSSVTVALPAVTAQTPSKLDELRAAVTVEAAASGSTNYAQPASGNATIVSVTPNTGLTSNLKSKDSSIQAEVVSTKQLAKSISEHTIKKLKEDLSKTLDRGN